jgi:diadenosine tetraphosphate (Ap4A) HIT family hydrolase
MSHGLLCEPACVLCEADDKRMVELIAATDELRVVRVLDQSDYPAFWRVIWRDHVSELTDLLPIQRSHLMQTVCKVEQAVRDILQPHKINLASLGNVVPHLHWHIIARWRHDSHFPQPIWADRQRATDSVHLLGLRALLPKADQAIVRAFQMPAYSLD